MMEVSVIEIRRTWRSAGIARKILELVLEHPLKEDRIIYMVGYSWTWDLDGTNITPIKYRVKLINLFTPENFKIIQTNEPNIMLRPENHFMDRIGTNISEELQKTFKMIRFNIYS